MPTWLWHPKKEVNVFPSEEDYRCCCGACTSKCGFTCITVTSLIYYMIFGFFLLIAYLASGPVGWIVLGATVTLMFCALMAICQPKPVYMQIYFVVSLAINSLILLFYVIGTIASWVQYFQASSNHQAQEVIDKKLSAAISHVVTLPILVIVIVWSWFLTYSYYSYLRDKQLYEEKHGAPNSVQVIMQPQPPVQQQPPPYPTQYPAKY